MESVADWSALPADLFGPIASRLNSAEDFMALRGVCQSWRAAAAINRDRFVCKLPLLMLAEKDDAGVCEFYSLSRRRICMRIPVPEARGKRCLDVGFGWLLALSTEVEGEACLLNPFSSARIQLPNFTTLPRYRRLQVYPPCHFMERGWLTANPSETPDFSLVVIMVVNVGFWRNGDLKWTRVKPPGGGPTVTYFKGKICVLDTSGHILIWDPRDLIVGRKPEGLVFDVEGTATSLCDIWLDYLVGSTAGELLIVRRVKAATRNFIPTMTKHFRLMRVDPVERKCIKVNGLGKDAVFLGQNAAVSVDATQFPGVLRPNCIYFTDDRHRNPEPDDDGIDMGIFSLEDKSIQRFGDVESISRICPPLWLFPSF